MPDCTAWAVGLWEGYYTGPLIEYWDGTKWTIQVKSQPSITDNTGLFGVAGTSSTNAWAVGTESPYAYSPLDPLIMGWNGTGWQDQSVPPSTMGGDLRGVAATSSTNAWAVGEQGGRTLVEQWNGTAWEVQPTPSVTSGKSYASLYGVAATSPTDAWAVGSYWVKRHQAQALIEHWDGTAWQIVESPNPGVPPTDVVVRGVAATSPTNAWVVGEYGGGPWQPLIEHWNGTAWTVQKFAGPDGPPSQAVLSGVTATSATNAWAVGHYRDGRLVLHWNGTAWHVQKSPNPGKFGNYLYAVSATSPTNAWAVGSYYVPQMNGIIKALALHWNGTTWTP
jgi:hypothetical protein